MRTLLIVALIVFITPQIYAQTTGSASTHLVVATGCKTGIPVRCGAHGACQITGHVYPQCKIPLRQCCEKIDKNGNVWAKVEIQGWIKVSNGNNPVLRPRVTGSNQWEVLPCHKNSSPVFMCTGRTQIEQPVCKLQPCTVVNKTSSGSGSIYGKFTGWVVKESGGVKFFCER